MILVSSKKVQKSRRNVLLHHYLHHYLHHHFYLLFYNSGTFTYLSGTSVLINTKHYVNEFEMRSWQKSKHPVNLNIRMLGLFQVLNEESLPLRRAKNIYIKELSSSSASKPVSPQHHKHRYCKIKKHNSSSKKFRYHSIFKRSELSLSSTSDGSSKSFQRSHHCISYPSYDNKSYHYHYPIKVYINQPVFTLCQVSFIRSQYQFVFNHLSAYKVTYKFSYKQQNATSKFAPIPDLCSSS